MNSNNSTTGNGYGHKGAATGYVAKNSQKSQNGTQKNPQDLYRRNY